MRLVPIHSYLLTSSISSPREIAKILISLFIAQALPHILPTPFPELLWVLPPHLRRFHVRGAFIVRTTEHTDDAKEDRFRCLYG